MCADVEGQVLHPDDRVVWKASSIKDDRRRVFIPISLQHTAKQN